MFTHLFLTSIFLAAVQSTLVRDCYEAADQLQRSQNLDALKEHRNWQLLPHESCGHRKNKNLKSFQKVFNGVDADYDEFPWMAKTNLVDDGSGNIHCGGAIISNKYILTAAHCCNATDSSDNAVWFLGSDYVSLSSRTIYSQEFRVHEENYKCQSTEVGKHDICLVRLKSEIAFTDNIQPICLPLNDTTDHGDKMVVAGWGRTDGETKSYPTILQKKTVTLISQDDCRAKYSVVDAREICTTYGACYGDSGGPLMKSYTVNDKETWFLFGIIAWGAPGCPLGEITVYPRVSEYMKWILDHLEP